MKIGRNLLETGDYLKQDKNHNFGDLTRTSEFVIKMTENVVTDEFIFKILQ